jgi:hypothetical protein
MSEPVLYKLRDLFKRQGHDCFELSIRPPTMKDLKIMYQAGTNPADRLAKMIELLAGLTAREVDELSVLDVAGLGEIVSNFFSLEACLEVVTILLVRCHWPASEIEPMTEADLKFWASFAQRRGDEQQGMP